ncbi:MAG: glycoside hydrolase family 43 protein [Treponema sp.]|nr:glycoside hydrolase family 43 protein [Treponema sp.]
MLTEDFEGYLFGHFIGEGDGNGEQIYFAVSEDGLHFKDLNGGKPVLVSNVGEKGVRDPFLCRTKEGDRFVLIATDLSIFHRGGWIKNEQGYYDASTTGSPYLVLWQSSDLVHWGEPKLIKVAPENAGMAWAPEMVWCEEIGEYVIFFSSSIMNPETKMKAKPNAIYYVTTKNFEKFSEPKLFIDCQSDGSVNGKEREIIDTTVLKVGDWYYSASKDGDNAEENGGIRILKTKTLLKAESWEKVLDLDELGLNLSDQKCQTLTNTSLEGPELFMFNKKDWADSEVPEYGLIADQYMAGAGYLPLKTTDLEDRNNAKGSWKILSENEYSFDKLKKRHGTILNITRQELENLKKAFDK